MTTLQTINSQLSEAIDNLDHDKVTELRFSLCTALNEALSKTPQLEHKTLYAEFQRLDQKYFDYCDQSTVQRQSHYRTTEAYKIQYPKIVNRF